MSRYVLELFNGQGWLPGAEAQDFADAQAAYEWAIYSIRDVAAGEIREGVQINLAHFISIRDLSGHEVRRVSFREAISFIDPGDRNSLK